MRITPFVLAALLVAPVAGAETTAKSTKPVAKPAVATKPVAKTSKAMPKPIAKQAAMPMKPTVADATYKDINQTLGFVPQFLRSAAPALLPGFWLSLKNFQMSRETQLDLKTKELIGLAVAAQIPCEYCIQFHTAMAKKNGATDQEVQEAVGMAALTREASTMINGGQVDKAQFKRDLDRLVEKPKQQAARK